MRRFYYLGGGTEKHVFCNGCGRGWLAPIIDHPSCDFCGGMRSAVEVDGCLVVEDERSGYCWYVECGDCGEKLLMTVRGEKGMIAHAECDCGWHRRYVVDLGYLWVFKEN